MSCNQFEKTRWRECSNVDRAINLVFVAIAVTLVPSGLPAAAYEPVETIAASGSPSQLLSPYHNSETGLDLKYPRDWTLRANPDKDCLVKISGVKDGAGGEMSVNANTDPSMTYTNLAKSFQLMMFPHLANFKMVSEKNIAFGARQKMRGLMDDVAFEMNGMPIRQRYVFFEHGGKTIVVTFTSTAQQFEKLVPTYNDILLSITPGAAGHERNSGEHANDSGAWQLTRLQPSNLPLRFSVPSGWAVAEHPDDPDRPLEVTGQNANGQSATIALFSGDLHPFATIEQAIAGLEERYWKTKPGYRQTKQETTSFGSSGRLDGVIHEAAFELNGRPALQRTIFFRQGDRLYVLAIFSAGWKDNEINALFHKMLATVETK